MTLPFSLHDILFGLLAFLRVGAIFFALPIFGDESTPMRSRILMSAAITLSVLPIAMPSTQAIPLDSLEMIFFYAIKEILIGLTIGFAARLTFQGLVAAAQVVAFQMGFNTAQLFLPTSDEENNALTAMHRLFMIMIFFSLNFHYVYIRDVFQTFIIVPLGEVSYNAGLFDIIMKLFVQLSATAISLASPILITLLFATAILGLLGRTIPQLNLFVLSFPINFFLGLIIYIASFPLYYDVLKNQFEGAARDYLRVIESFALSSGKKT